MTAPRPHVPEEAQPVAKIAHRACEGIPQALVAQTRVIGDGGRRILDLSPENSHLRGYDTAGRASVVSVSLVFLSGLALACSHDRPTKPSATSSAIDVAVPSTVTTPPRRPDGPLIWQVENPQPVAAPLRAVTSTKNAMVAVGDGVIVRSQDGGNSWTVTERPDDKLVGVWGTGETLVAVGLHTRLLSTDDGVTWNPTRVETSLDASLLGGIAWHDTKVQDLFGVWGSSPSDVYVVGRDLLSHSIDGGQTWRDEVRDGEELRAVCGSSAEDVFAVGSHIVPHFGLPRGAPAGSHTGFVLHTSDRGATWHGDDIGPPHGLGACWARSPSDVYVGALAQGKSAGGLWHLTSPGGAWKKICPACESVLAIWGHGSQDVYVASLPGTCRQPAAITAADTRRPPQRIGVTMFHSSDGGATWQSADGEDAARRPGCHASTGEDFYLYRGQQRPYASGGLGGDAAGDVVFVGHGGTILRRDSETKKWSEVSSGSRANLHGVSVRGNEIVAVGDGGTIVRSTDDGTTYQEQHVADAALFGIAAFADGALSAVGTGIIVHTVDGVHWSSVPSISLPDGSSAPISSTVRAIWSDPAPSAQSAFAVGDGLVLRSLDRGEQWETVFQDKSVTLNTVWGASDTIVAAGQFGDRADDGVVLKTSDGGKTWTRSALTRGSLRGIWGRSLTDLFVVGENTLLHSNDGGATWNTTSRIDWTDGGLGIYWTGVAGTTNGDLYLTEGVDARLERPSRVLSLSVLSSGGLQMKAPPRKVGSRISAIAVSVAGEAVAVGDSGLILHGRLPAPAVQ